jgi:flavin reductase (DIM6/NTAB) family NADH-FMN oxidoreductase RutF
MKREFALTKYPSIAYPKMSVVVTCGSEKVNGITLTWHTPISRDPPLFGISIAPQMFSYHIIKNEREFAVNFLELNHWKDLHYIGTHSGREVDKFAKLGLVLEDCSSIKTKRIADSYAVLECSLYGEFDLGDHTLFLGEVKKALIEENEWAGRVVARPIYQVGSYSYTTVTGEEIRP